MYNHRHFLKEAPMHLTQLHLRACSSIALSFALGVIAGCGGAEPSDASCVTGQVCNTGGSTSTDATTAGSGGASGGSGGGTGSGGAPTCASGEIQPCYSGPPGTEDVGICKA